MIRQRRNTFSLACCCFVASTYSCSLVILQPALQAAVLMCNLEPSALSECRKTIPKSNITTDQRHFISPPPKKKEKNLYYQLFEESKINPK